MTGWRGLVGPPDNGVGINRLQMFPLCPLMLVIRIRSSNPSLSANVYHVLWDSTELGLEKAFVAINEVSSRDARDRANLKAHDAGMRGA